MRGTDLLKALVIAVVMCMAMGVVANAASITINSGSDTDSATAETTSYTYYQYLIADIGENATVDVDTGEITAEGKVAYYVTNEELATALAALEANEGTKLFTVTKASGATRWNVTLNDTSADGGDIATALDTLDTDLAISTGTFAQTTPGGSATASDLAAGYYLIKSSLGTKLAVQTLSAVTINEKNDYPSVDKNITGENGTDVTKTKSNDVNIGDEITYTVDVVIPASVAEKAITVTDTMHKGLTLNTSSLTAVNDDEEDNEITGLSFSNATVSGDYNVYTITIPAATVSANAGKTITLTYTAKLNADAVVDGGGNPNKVKLQYDNFTTKDVETVTKTYDYSIRKIDGDTEADLTGAEFILYKNYDATTKTGSNPVTFKSISGGYQVIADGESGSTTISAGKIELKGLDAGTYYLVETKAPEGGYNILDGATTITVSASTGLSTGSASYDAVAEADFDATATYYESDGEGGYVESTATEWKEGLYTQTAGSAVYDSTIENNKGTTLPSTGGMGTTLIYIIGAVIVVAAGVLLVTRRRMHAQ